MNAFVSNLKQFFYDEPMAFVGTVLVVLGLITLIGLVTFLLPTYIGGYGTVAVLSIIAIVVGLCVVEGV